MGVHTPPSGMPIEASKKGGSLPSHPESPGRCHRTAIARSQRHTESLATVYPRPRGEALETVHQIGVTPHNFRNPQG